MDDVNTLQNACTLLYASARCNKLATTLTLMNMCMIHGSSNKLWMSCFPYCTIFCCMWIIVCLTMSQPHFEGSVRSPLTIPKMGLESPPGLSKIQNSIAEVKTPRIEVFFIPLERSRSVNV
jgi:hypothetical protein